MFSDSPGANTRLRPEAAPVWLQPLVRAVDGGHVHRALSDRARYAGPQRDRQAAVLMLIDGPSQPPQLPPSASVLLTHRSPRMRNHSGQIAFPGGRVDPSDVNAVDCALREAHEETGLNRAAVTPLAQMEEVHVRRTGYPVYPVIAYQHAPAEVSAVSLEETDDVFRAPIAELVEPDNRLMVGHGSWRGPAFRCRGYIVWGFTGGILSAALAQAGWARPWAQDRVYDLRATLAASRNNERHF
ncbi:putative NUDIX hydrolase [Corynebacterium ciconiae DSM 44920]|uniref:NUDIX hydrolase n=1 Tax=Corynebacterium ciconiae TaxID=227319 RepID=UPI00036D925C|nr:CoA pyrophosphatase [Corynebacterium ciconiae]WKD62197.1 putative NUDIX hydrolase [Corynebacterium ciconiae DSM 44920]